MSCIITAHVKKQTTVSKSLILLSAVFTSLSFFVGPLVIVERIVILAILNPANIEIAAMTCPVNGTVKILNNGT
jgi:hypothetical protein